VCSPRAAYWRQEPRTGHRPELAQQSPHRTPDTSSAPPNQVGNRGRCRPRRLRSGLIMAVARAPANEQQLRKLIGRVSTACRSEPKGQGPEDGRGPARAGPARGGANLWQMAGDRPGACGPGSCHTERVCTVIVVERRADGKLFPPGGMLPEADWQDAVKLWYALRCRDHLSYRQVAAGLAEAGYKASSTPGAVTGTAPVILAVLLVPVHADASDAQIAGRHPSVRADQGLFPRLRMPPDACPRLLQSVPCRPRSRYPLR
jgi:hypothetical protein